MQAFLPALSQPKTPGEHSISRSFGEEEQKAEEPDQPTNTSLAKPEAQQFADEHEQMVAEINELVASGAITEEKGEELMAKLDTSLANSMKLKGRRRGGGQKPEAQQFADEHEQMVAEINELVASGAITEEKGEELMAKLDATPQLIHACTQILNKEEADQIAVTFPKESQWREEIENISFSQQHDPAYPYQGMLAVQQRLQALGVDPAMSQFGRDPSLDPRSQATGLGLATELVSEQRRDVLEQRLRRLVQNRLEDGYSAGGGSAMIAAQIVAAHRELDAAKDDLVRARAERLEEELMKAQIQIEVGQLGGMRVGQCDHQGDGWGGGQRTGQLQGGGQLQGREHVRVNKLIEEVELNSRLAQSQLERQVLEADLSWARERANLERMREEFNVLCTVKTMEIEGTIGSTFGVEHRTAVSVPGWGSASAANSSCQSAGSMPASTRILGSDMTHRQLATEVLDTARISSELAMEVLRESATATSDRASAVLGMATLPGIGAVDEVGGGGVDLYGHRRYDDSDLSTSSKVDVEMRLKAMQLSAEAQAMSSHLKELDMLEARLQQQADARSGVEKGPAPREVPRRVLSAGGAEDELLDRAIWAQQMRPGDAALQSKRHLGARTRRAQKACEDVWIAAEHISSSAAKKAGARREVEAQQQPHPPPSTCPSTSRSPRPSARWSSYGRQ
jgi:hypothetical protein